MIHGLLAHIGQVSQVSSINQIKEEILKILTLTLGKAPRSIIGTKKYFEPIVSSGKITWWVERVNSLKGDLKQIRKKIREGPLDVEKC